MKIVLASKSGVRKDILDRYGVKSIVAPSNVDEDQVKESLIAEKATPEIISKSYAKTHDLFASFWAENYKIFDCVLCLGDRFEMAAAVNAGVPFNVKFAHIHSGETTLGAIDNIYRHQITLASKFHFTSNPF